MELTAPSTTLSLSTDGRTFKYCLPYSSEGKPPNVEVRWASKHARRGRPLTPTRSVHFVHQDMVMGEEGDIGTGAQNPPRLHREATTDHRALPTFYTCRATLASIERQPVLIGASSSSQRTNEPSNYAMPDFTQLPKRRKVYNEDFYLESYTSCGPSELRYPPELPARHTASIGQFLLHVVDGQNTIQIWRINGFGPDGRAEWVSMAVGDVELINGKEYRLAYSGGMLGWVTNNTVGRQARRKSNGKGKAKA
ncbi:hypothetical protein BDN71DRAFT_1436984 [Pleurotus eryngii]|uniref:Uncharacterized protein n=1 Tax=Pleurotus eryngii TaxID=5323 RepID=A0A9P6D8Z9_PLEER|nr:hypothetical protein BDN71DRAFT_1436984 [Pleurotus eryngii]